MKNNKPNLSDILEIFKENDKKTDEKIKKISHRGESQYIEVENIVKEIVNKIKCDGDSALLDFTKRFDKVTLTTKNIRVSSLEIKQAYKNINNKKFLPALERAHDNILNFHKTQVESSKFLPGNGYILGQIIKPIKRAGVYIPGGRAPLVSTVLMNTIPAKLAGVPEIIMVTPPDKTGKINPYLLIAADIIGIKTIFKMGGAQAIAALAYGTKTIPKVDKIVGPGNIYVALAKKYVFGQVDIDMIAGPSEILIIADEEANPEFIAADLLSQAEHDERASSVLITTSLELAEKVKDETLKQLKKLKRKDIAIESLKNFGGIFLFKNIEKAIEISNTLAPEHLELQIKDPFKWIGKIENAGAIFAGHYSPEAVGDYIAGPNHVLPTGGTSRFFSPLGVYDFIKRSSLIYYSKEKLQEMSPYATVISETEGLEAHTNSITKRVKTV
ncbi:histidinol dehydrogenase [Candidatus Poribacteria bacterium]|nr:histidinol dehydrogenase [Candidatus Poribacteria bacterium]